MRLIPIDLSEKFEKGLPYFFDYGYPCCQVPGVDYENDPTVRLPKGIHCRVGHGIRETGSVHQDPALFHANKHRIQVINAMTELGVEVPVIRGEGDHDGLTGGYMLLKPFDQVITWESGVGVRATLIFSPRDEYDAVQYFNMGLRGILNRTFRNEGFAAMEVTIREKLFKISYYHNAQDGDAGGSRVYVEYPFNFEWNRWYKIEQRLIPIPNEEYTWDAKVRVSAMHDPKQRIVWRAEPDMRPNHIVTVEHMAWGDEHMQIDDGGANYYSYYSAVAIPPRSLVGEKRV